MKQQLKYFVDDMLFVIGVVSIGYGLGAIFQNIIISGTKSTGFSLLSAYLIGLAAIFMLAARITEKDIYFGFNTWKGKISALMNYLRAGAIITITIGFISNPDLYFALFTLALVLFFVKVKYLRAKRNSRKRKHKR